MKFFKVHFLLLFISLQCLTMYGQTDVNLKKSSVDLSPLVEVYQSDIVRFKNHIPIFHETWQNQSISGLSRGPFDRGHWYKISLSSNKEVEKVLYFNYSLIQVLDIWIKSSNGGYKHLEGGTENNRLQQMIKSSDKGYNYLLKFEEEEVKDIFFHLKGNGWPIHTEVLLYNKDTFIEKYHSDFQILGYLRGIVVTLLCIGFLISIFSKQKVFLYYVCTILSGVLFAESEIGTFIKFLGIKYHDFNYLFRHVFNLTFVYFLIHFYNHILPDRKLFIDAIQKANPFIALYFFLSMFTLIALHSENFVAVNFVVIVLLSWLSFVLCTVVLYRNRKHSTLSKYIFYLHICRIATIAIFVTLPHLGIIKRSSITDYVYYIFIVYESIIYFYLLMRRSLTIYNEKLLLMQEVDDGKRKYSNALLEGQEKERNRIGRELHDTIGGNLAIVNKSKALENLEVKDILSQTIDSIRDLSHDLVSPSFQHISLKESIIDLVAKYSSVDQKIQLQFHDWPQVEDTRVKNHCFRITQELLNNSLKHSQSTNIFIQFFGTEDKKGRIVYEDNGVGFEVGKVKNGIGLDNIRFRVTTLKALLTIESSSNGTTIVVDDISFDLASSKVKDHEN